MRFFLIVFLTIVLYACSASNEPVIYTSYSGNWKCEETGSISGYTEPYYVTIDQNKNDTTLYFIRNFSNGGDNLMIVVKITGTEVNLIQQPTAGYPLRLFRGSAIPYTTIKLNYTLFNGERDIFYEAQYSRK